MDIMSNAKPIDDLELYELMVAAYPEKFDENSEDDIWYEVMEFAEDKFGDLEPLCELLGRVVLLTAPMGSVISGELSHCLGMSDVLERMLKESEELRKKIGVIRSLIWDNDSFDELPKPDQVLLIEQHSAMRLYSEKLSMRIARFRGAHE